MYISVANTLVIDKCPCYPWLGLENLTNIYYELNSKPCQEVYLDWSQLIYGKTNCVIDNNYWPVILEINHIFSGKSHYHEQRIVSKHIAKKSSEFQTD